MFFLLAATVSAALILAASFVILPLIGFGPILILPFLPLVATLLQ